MSHHFDSAAGRADGRINPCDLYAFPAAPGTTALILTVNPDAGRSSPTTFRPDALYEFVVASNGGTSEDTSLRITFTEPGDDGRQQVRVLCASGPAARHGAAGAPLGEGRTGEVFSLSDNGLAWAGLAADPFNGDGIALVHGPGRAAGEEMTVKHVRIDRPRIRRERPWLDDLPAAPRDPDVVRVKALARAQQASSSRPAARGR